MNSTTRNALEKAASAYELFRPLADEYLGGRGLCMDLAVQYRLGVVVEPEIGHEAYEGRLSIPYLTRAGVVNMKFRCMEEHELSCKDAGHEKYLGLSGGRTNIYNTLAFFKDSPVIGISEGEIDAAVMDALVGIPTVGIPGARNWKPHFDRCFTDYERVLLFADGDTAGRDFARHVASILDGVTVIHMPEGMDVNTVYQAEGPEGLRKRAGL